MSTNENIFVLTNFSPIGFKKINYPVQYCPLCRGFLTDVCQQCVDRKSEKCNVINSDGAYYHHHCFTFLNNQSKKK